MPTVPSSSGAPEKDDPRPPDCRTPSALNSELTVLEKDVPISQSLIWGVQREYYIQRGLKSWTEDTVPQFITNNPLIAEIYARIVLGFLCDCRKQAQDAPCERSARSPLRILELGAGTGKFAFLFLRKMEELLTSHGIRLDTIRYCMTDCSDHLVEAWRANPLLAEFLDRGVLEFGLLGESGQVSPRPVKTTGSQVSETTIGPLVVIANYFFDSLPHDAFSIDEGRVFEVLQTAAAISSNSSNSVPSALASLQLSYRNVLAAPGRYTEPSWKSIVEDYRERLSGATILFPSHALTTLKTIGKLTDGPMLVVTADKGYVHEQDLLLSSNPPKFEFHAPNCFSQMVNFDALAKYFIKSGGDALLPNRHSSSLNVCLFLQGGPADKFPAVRSTYQEAQSNLGPDDLFALLAWLNPHMEEMSVPQILALLRLTRWDPTAFMRIFPVLASQIRNASSERDDLHNAVLLTWANHFPISEHESILAFYCGVILLELRFFHDAASMFKKSQDLSGRSAATSYNLGLCEVGLGRLAEARALMAEAGQRDANFEPAHLAGRALENASRRNVAIDMGPETIVPFRP